ncbi:aspartate/glutamate racemase family protein [Planococcus sp. FY231025]|uniref:aspartate/glutamate racemase family protein n=1 Tax=Planococcus sp. FY231025 TaxID=3455699 RepID=UPI003F8E15FE
MKTIGLIGGMSWESSAEYYRILNEEAKRQLGGLHSAKCILYSLDFEEIEALQVQGKWQEAGEVLGAAAESLERAGAEFIVICTNTMHKAAGTIEQNVGIPLLHIGDATAVKVKGAGIRKIGLLGTRYTMEMDFYKSRLEAHGLEAIIPEEGERQEINRIIFEELCLGEIRETSKAYYLKAISNLEKRGAEGVILGCTEIGLLVKSEDTDALLFDTTAIHALAAMEKALGK